MHIGLLIYGDLNIRTGGFLYDRKLVEELGNRGHEVSIFSLPWRSYTAQLFDNLGKHLLDWLSKQKLDVLLQDELLHPSLFYLNSRAQRVLAGPIISIVHHLRSSESAPFALKTIYAWIERAYFQSVNGLCCNSKSTLRSVHDLIRKPILPSVVAYPGRDHFNPGISSAQVKARLHSAGPLRLFFLGSIIPRKGLATLIDALAGIDQNLWRLDIVGDTSFDPHYHTSLRHRIRGLALQDNITWHGAVDDQQLRLLWERAHMLVVPSEYEGFGIVYLEAMAHGVVPIASKEGGASELIDHGVNGYLVEPGDVAGLRAIIQQLHDDRSQLSALGLAAQDRYAKHPTWSESTSIIESFLVESVSTYRRAE